MLLNTKHESKNLIIFLMLLEPIIHYILLVYAISFLFAKKRLKPLVSRWSRLLALISDWLKVEISISLSIDL
jgi:hypothetical protein